MPTLDGGNVGRRYNYDGHLAYDGAAGHGFFGYAQVFRNGSIELAAITGRPDDKTVNPWNWETQLVEALRFYLPRLKEHGVELPLVVLVSVLGVRGYGLRVSNLRRRGGEPIVDRDTLLLPDVLVEDYAVDVPRMMKPVFDAMWQALGMSRSLCYQEDGTWIHGWHDW